MRDELLSDVVGCAACAQCGEVKDVIVLKDKVTGQPKSCAFVSYATEAEAERAIEMLDRKLQLPGATSPMEVRWPGVPFAIILKVLRLLRARV